MPHLIQARCLNHPDREAVARCPMCGHTFCRECVTDHQGRVVCSKCLEAIARSEPRPRRGWKGVGAVIQSLTGIVLMWMLLYGVGRLLLAIPQTFHEGSVWSSSWSDDEP